MVLYDIELSDMSNLPRDPSRLRQRLGQTIARWTELVRLIQGERGPLVRGVYVEAGRRCGKPSCRCAQGELHRTAMISAKIGGRTRNTYVPLKDRERIREAALRYRRLRRARAEMAKLTRETLALIDALQQALTRPHPSDDGGPRE
jgi:hypothetical protein